MPVDLPFVWALLIAFAVLAYVVLDGFDLGIGLLFPMLSADERNVAMNSIAPVWDGNETWLVLGGGGLLAAFPLAYSVTLTAFYPLIIAMLLGLVLRGVAFEFRGRSGRARPIWEAGFVGGSAVAALAQGIMIGAYVQGIRVEGRAYAGGWLDWLSPFTLVAGAALVAGYALLGATWLVWRSEGDLQLRARRIGRALTPVVIVGIAAVGAWTLASHPVIRARWLSPAGLALSALIALLAGVSAVRLRVALERERHLEPFLATLALFATIYLALGLSVYPDIVPPSLSIRDAAAPDESLRFLLVGAAVLIPLILAYTFHAYWVFRGKVTADAGYH